MTISTQKDSKWKRSITSALRMAYSVVKTLPIPWLGWVFFALMVVWELVKNFI